MQKSKCKNRTLTNGIEVENTTSPEDEQSSGPFAFGSLVPVNRDRATAGTLAPGPSHPFRCGHRQHNTA